MFVYTLIDVIALASFAIITLPIVIFHLIHHIKKVRKQDKCKHECGVFETSRLDAICRSCGKNLGFIGFAENKKRRIQK